MRWNELKRLVIAEYDRRNQLSDDIYNILESFGDFLSKNTKCMSLVRKLRQNDKMVIKEEYRRFKNLDSLDITEERCINEIYNQLESKQCNKIYMELVKYVFLYCIFILLLQYCNVWFLEIAIFIQDFNFGLVLNKVVWLVACLILFVCSLWNRVLNFKVAFLITAIYFTFRCFDVLHPDWSFMKYGGIYYFDIPVGLFFISGILNLNVVRKFGDKFIKKSKEQGERTEKNEKTIKSAVKDENSIKRKEDDKFGFYEEAESFLDKINECEYLYKDNALVVGLEGEWGSGKTSFINMMENVIFDKELNFKLIKFSSWNYRTSEQLTIELLSTIANEIGVKDVTKAIKKYIKVFEGTSYQWISNIIKLFCGKEKTTQGYFNDVNNKLKASTETLIIAVDDIDRLVKEEVLEVLKLVRNTANFRNIVYVVAYDRRYVEETLKEYGINNSGKYLEKIFNVPFLLPEKSIEQRKELYKEILQKNIFFNKTDKTDNGIVAFVDEFGEYISIRNVKKLAKQLLVNTPFIREDGLTFELDVYDCLILYYINIKYPEIYAHLYSLLNSISKGNNSNNLILYNGGYGIIMLNKLVDPYNLINPEIINDDEYINRISGVTKNGDEDVIYKLLYSLFDIEKIKSAYNISHLDAFPIYFTRKIPSNCVKVDQFIKESKGGRFRQVLSDWNKESNRAILCNIIEYLDFNKYKKMEYYNIINTIISEIATDKMLSPDVYSKKEKIKSKIIPGIELKRNRKNKAYINVWRDILNDVTVNATFFQRFVILQDNRIHEYIYEHDDYIELYFNYIKRYLKTINDYNTFNTEVWYSIVPLCNYAKEYKAVYELQEIFKKHILSNIINFISSFDKFRNDSFIAYLFTPLAEINHIQNKNTWYNDFKQFVQDNTKNNSRIIELLP